MNYFKEKERYNILSHVYYSENNFIYYIDKEQVILINKLVCLFGIPVNIFLIYKMFTSDFITGLVIKIVIAVFLIGIMYFWISRLLYLLKDKDIFGQVKVLEFLKAKELKMYLYNDKIVIPNSINRQLEGVSWYKKATTFNANKIIKTKKIGDYFYIYLHPVGNVVIMKYPTEFNEEQERQQFENWNNKNYEEYTDVKHIGEEDVIHMIEEYSDFPRKLMYTIFNYFLVLQIFPFILFIFLVLKEWV